MTIILDRVTQTSQKAKPPQGGGFGYYGFFTLSISARSRVAYNTRPQLSLS